MDKASDYLPALMWLRSYSGADLKADMVAGLVVTMMLIPQSLIKEKPPSLFPRREGGYN